MAEHALVALDLFVEVIGTDTNAVAACCKPLPARLSGRYGNHSGQASPHHGIEMVLITVN